MRSKSFRKNKKNRKNNTFLRKLIERNFAINFEKGFFVCLFYLLKADEATLLYA